LGLDINNVSQTEVVQGDLGELPVQDGGVMREYYKFLRPIHACLLGQGDDVPLFLLF
jgi:hypothetical protein